MLLGNFRHTWQFEDLVLGRCRTEKRLVFLSTFSLMTKQPLLPAACSAHVFGCDVVKNHFRHVAIRTAFNAKVNMVARRQQS